MNKQERDVLLALYEEPFINHRITSEQTGHSLGIVNRSIKNLIAEGYLNEMCQVTAMAQTLISTARPQNAIILAAGFGMRMVPINRETPKGLLEVNGQPLIERQIIQLHEAGVQEIYVVAGFMKESFEYLIDKYGVELVVNKEYAAKNNLSSLALVSERLGNTYIVPCDVWCDKNVFHAHEMYSWYMVSDLVDDDSDVRVNRKMELVRVDKKNGGNTMVGISYLSKQDAQVVRERLGNMRNQRKYDPCFWEEVLYEKDKMILQARIVRSTDVVEINTYEQLRDLDSHSNQLKSDAIDIICNCLNCMHSEVTDITVLKKGMTNRSFLFACRDKKYIMRIPGEGTDMLIDREQEAAVYSAISDKGISDNIIYMDPSNGYKITEFIEGARVCDPGNVSDLKKCMCRLREFHALELKVGHTFDLFGQIEFYESLWNGERSVYRDYGKTKENVLSLRTYINRHVDKLVLTHIDAVPDNFLFSEQDGTEKIRLIDWEYAGMQDPHVDIAMFCIYALYDRRQVNRLINLYFEGKCKEETRIKIYCYIAVCGLLWSNWCEYKRSLGVEFGEYSLRQYRYAKEYYKLACEEMKKLEEVEA